MTDPDALTRLHQQLRDALGRPMPINLGQPLTGLFG